MPDLPDIAKAEIAIIELTNRFRAQEKLGAVKPNAQLALAAKLYAQYLAKTGQFAHEADGRQPADRAKASGYTFCTIAENLALNLDSRGFKTEALASQAVEGWKKSPGHRRNMVAPEVTEIGVGIAKAADKDPKYISVQLFGRPDSHKFRFKVENRSGSSVAYSALGKAHTIETGVVVTHTVCAPGPVQFERAGNWLTGTKLSARYEAADGATYVVTSAPGRGAAVEVKAGPAR